jgi:hypothetical protein
MALMSRQGGGRGTNGGGVARGASFAAAKGFVLIALAVIIGIVLLNVYDDGGVSEPEAESPSASTTAPDDTSGGEGTTTTTAAGPPRAPQELSVVVLNGGAPAGSAGDMSDALKQAGYTNQLQPSDWDGRDEPGTAVLCKEGLDQEAAALAAAIGGGARVEEFPDPAPPSSEGADCVVAVGPAPS